MKYYRFKYSIEGPGRFPKPTEGERPIPGVLLTNKPYGLADELLLVSIVGNGKDSSYLILSTEAGGGLPTPELLTDLRDKLTHWLEHHARPEET